MRLLESKKGLSFFAFDHNEEYQQAQHKFLVAVESMEPNNIVVCDPAAPDGCGGRGSSSVLRLGWVPLGCGELCLRNNCFPLVCAEQSDHVLRGSVLGTNGTACRQRRATLCSQVPSGNCVQGIVGSFPSCICCSDAAQGMLGPLLSGSLSLL